MSTKENKPGTPSEPRIFYIPHWLSGVIVGLLLVAITAASYLYFNLPVLTAPTPANRTAQSQATDEVDLLKKEVTALKKDRQANIDQIGQIIGHIETLKTEVGALRAEQTGLSSARIPTRVENVEKALTKLLTDLANSEKARKAQDPNTVIEIPPVVDWNQKKQ